MEPTSGNWIAADDVNRLVRQIDVALNGADSWAANPWVWCVEFKRVKP